MSINKYNFGIEFNINGEVVMAYAGPIEAADNIIEITKEQLAEFSETNYIKAYNVVNGKLVKKTDEEIALLKAADNAEAELLAREAETGLTRPIREIVLKVNTEGYLYDTALELEAMAGALREE